MSSQTPSTECTTTDSLLLPRALDSLAPLVAALAAVLPTSLERRIAEREAAHRELVAQLVASHERHVADLVAAHHQHVADLAAEHRRHTAALEHRVAALEQQLAAAVSPPRTPPADLPVRRPTSHWDRLPFDVRRIILIHTDVWTQVQTGFVDPMDLLPRERVELWAAVFDADIDDNLESVPFWRDLASMPATLFWHIRSQRMFHHVRSLGLAGIEENLAHAATKRRWHNLATLDSTRDRSRVQCCSAELQSTHELYPLVYSQASNTIEAVAAARVGAIANAVLVMSRYSQETNDEIRINLLDHAAASGRLDVVQRLHEQGVPCTTLAMDNAAEAGHIGTVAWLSRNRDEGCSPNAIVRAAANGHADVVAYLHKHHNMGNTAAVLRAAIQHGQLRVVEWVYRGTDVRASLYDLREAREAGHACVAEWLLANDVLLAERARFRI
ncbi:LON peptidase N-terminal domain and RING finger protein 2 [Polyrhizophydium stewartii]|uniref:LON peptidase N-terminal domain and RING finger protein 2 n=1 Tax=Polyrhizophydium stewartii TaxID=2732419 RepID=A0ABR4NKS1_9FUNG|nr:hypothetical protein HK105_006721 [Polyrhizophydium stewartii]